MQRLNHIKAVLSPPVASHTNTQKINFRLIHQSIHKNPHTLSKINFVTEKMKVVQIPLLSDNYSYLIIDDRSKIAAAVDPAEPKKVIETAKSENVRITTVLTTHHHWDHAGGNEEMKATLPDIEIYGGDDRVNALTKKVKGDDTFQIGNLTVKVHYTPCHTSGHVLYEVSSSEGSKPHALFTGDTLFVGGCGRFFEGTADQMYHALCEVIANLPGDTLIYCGHEYTVKNLEFASTLEKDNNKLKEKLSWAIKQRSNKMSTVPSTIEEELSYNPFMRVKERSIQEVVGLTDPIEVMKEIRKRKDHF